MFTGIVQGTGTIISIDQKVTSSTFSIDLGELSSNLNPGSSVSVDGICMTVTSQKDSVVNFDAIQETLSRTTLGQAVEGDMVNLERALKMGDELGGHLLSGHIMSTSSIISKKNNGEGIDIKISLNEKLKSFVMEKGYIAIDGISLTVGTVENNSFNIHLIPETLERTTINSKIEGSMVNIEIDSITQAVVSTVSAIMKNQ
ncbi:MAG: riboflavin synthase subunit alpha [Candidatus Thalassarchaeaceae archaeon]|jgi:riboflavin synthase|tara:strand:- start:12169 stop:12771 length:603 start_codon:yes stop_codon:yes gene_type:complete